MVGIAFSPIQWLIVCRMKLSPERPSNGGGFSDHLIEEEEGFNIQNAISEGGLYFMHSRMVGVGKINTSGRRSIVSRFDVKGVSRFDVKGVSHFDVKGVANVFHILENWTSTAA